MQKTFNNTKKLIVCLLVALLTLSLSLTLPTAFGKAVSFTQYGNSSAWNYDADNDVLTGNGDRAMNKWKQTYALATNNSTNYYVGTKYHAINPSDSSMQSMGTTQVEQYIGLVPWYGDANNNIFVWLHKWTDGTQSTLFINAWLDGKAPAEGEFKSIALNTRVAFFAENYLEVQIIGDTVNVFIETSTSPVLSQTYAGLGAKISANKGYYGAYINNCGGEFTGLKQSSSRIYGSIGKPVIKLTNAPTVGYVGDAFSIPVAVLNDNFEYFIPTVTVTDANGDAVTVYGTTVDKNSILREVPYFVPTTAGTYTITINAVDRFGLEATPVTYSVTVSAQSAYTCQISYNGNGATSGSMNSTVLTYGGSSALSKNAFSKNGATFLGWALSKAEADAKVVKYADEQVLTSADMTADNVVLYAVWEGGESDQGGGGCGSEISLTTTVLGVLIVGAGALLVKKARKDSNV